MIIECVGPPGSGKTTLVKELADGWHNVKSVTQPVSRWYTFRYIFCHPFTAVWLIYMVLREGTASRTLRLTRFRLALIADTFGRIAWAGHYSDQIVLLDEGLLQRLLSLYETEQSLESLKRDVSIVLKGTIGVICFDTNLPFSNRYVAMHPRGRLGNSYVSLWRDMFLKHYKILRLAVGYMDIESHSFKVGDKSQNVRAWIESIFSTN